MKLRQNQTRKASEKDSKLAAIRVQFEREIVRIEVYQGPDGSLVVKRGRTWIKKPGSHERVPHILAGVVELLGRELAAGIGLPLEEQPTPELPRGSRVRIPNLARPDRFDATWTLSEPLRDAAGIWWVQVCGRRELVRVEDCAAGN